MANFTVDTHLFRELGELLVGRDSTALVELIKNAYDADASLVTVHGENLNSPQAGRIIISDNGIGMTPEQFETGFLRIASRIKEEGNRRSALFGRRYTGAKGIGRLAAHKLARLLEIESVPNPKTAGSDKRTVSAVIDWDIVESKETLGDLDKTKAILVTDSPRTRDAEPGTRIELRRLRRKWTPSERSRFFWEIGTFLPPAVLLHLPKGAVKETGLFDTPVVSDNKRDDPGFKVDLTGEFDAGEEYWQALLQAADWVIEIDAGVKDELVHFAILPTKRCLEEMPFAESRKLRIKHPSPKDGPFFQARILLREGSKGFRQEQRAWVGRQSGVRVYMEGFRVLPYGEPSDDWLEVDADAARRDRTLRFLQDIRGTKPAGDDEGLSLRRKEAYFGAVFLRQKDAPTLRMVVNREGFVADAALERLQRLVRVGIDLSARHSFATRHDLRAEWREVRSGARKATRLELKLKVERSVGHASELTRKARMLAAEGRIKEATELIEEAANELGEGSEVNERLLTERNMVQILAAVGLQMTAFVHEINGLLGMATSLESAVHRIRESPGLGIEVRKLLGQVHSSVGDLRRVVERQASYLTDITSPDARRKRAPQRLAERFDAAVALVKPTVERRDITVENSIHADLKSPPMFAAEITLVFSNLLTNAVKAAGKGGCIRASASSDRAGMTLRVENTGKAVKLAEAERWFRPFESTTTTIDPALGQGMGMGLPIARNILEEYGAEICFAKPTRGFATAVEIKFPEEGQ